MVDIEEKTYKHDKSRKGHGKEKIMNMHECYIHVQKCVRPKKYYMHVQECKKCVEFDMVTNTDQLLIEIVHAT